MTLFEFNNVRVCFFDVALQPTDHKNLKWHNPEKTTKSWKKNPIRMI
jgi:hypothetical protein